MSTKLKAKLEELARQHKLHIPLYGSGQVIYKVDPNAIAALREAVAWQRERDAKRMIQESSEQGYSSREKELFLWAAGEIREGR